MTATPPPPSPALGERLPSWAWLLLGAAASALTGPRWGIAGLAWVAPAPYLLYARRMNAARGLGALLGTLILAASVQTAPIVTEPLPTLAALGFGAPLGALWFVAIAGSEALRRLAGERAGVFGYAALTALCAYVGYGASELGVWMAMANGQVRALELLQLTSVIGMGGLSFLMGWVAALVARALASPRPAELTMHAAMLASLLGLASLWGSVRLDGSKPARTATVAAVVTDVGPDARGMPSADAMRANTEQLFERTALAAERGAQLVVWNEAATFVSVGEEQALLARGRAVARDLGVDLVLAYAVVLRTQPLYFDNKLAFVTSEGGLPYTYRKRHPAPGEPSMAGEEPLRVLERPYGRVGAAICYDYDFPSMAREHARAGAELVVLPSSDWRGIDPVHTLMSRARAVEGGFAVVRAARWSASAAFDALGRVRAWSVVAEHNDGVMLATVPVGRRETLYAAAGDVPVALSALYLLTVVGGWAWRCRRAACMPLGLLGALHGGCTSEVVASGEPTAHARAQLEQMVRDEELAGAQYLVVDAEHTLLDLHVGVADVANGVPMQRDTRQMAYSLTKSITAIAVMQLVDAGKMELDAPLSRYFREHPYGESVTIRGLLAHTAGVPNPAPLDWFAVEGESLDREEQLRRILAAHAELDDAAGESYGYSNVGYWLLEKAIEAASGEDYARYVQTEVFARVGVSPDAIAFDPDARFAHATGHSRRYSPMNLLLYLLTPSRYWAAPRGGWSRARPLRAIGRGYGGLYASAAAFAPVMQDLLRAQPRLMRAASRDAMLSMQHTRDGEATQATLGWVVGALHGTRYFGKQGGGLGFHGNLRIYPDRGIATVLLANRTEITPGPIDARSDRLDAAFVVRKQSDAGRR